MLSIWSTRLRLQLKLLAIRGPWKEIGMGRGLLSLLLLACCLSTIVQESQAAPDDDKGAKTPPSEGDLSPQRDADAPNATATVVDAPVNTRDGVSEATFVKRDDQPSDVDKEDVPSIEEEGVEKEGEAEGDETEKEKSKEEEDEEEYERPIITHIPLLPPSITKPGRLHNASWFVMFYASWCEHSQRAEPEFLKAIQMLSDSNVTGMYIGKIDITKHGDVAKHFKIKGTPTFVFFKFGVRFEFIEENKAEKLYEFATKIVNSKIDRVNTTQQLSDLQKNHSVLFLLVHDEEVDADWHSVYVKMASEKALIAKFAFTTEPDIVKEHGINRLPCVMVLKDGKAIVYKDSLSGYTLSRWVGIEKYLSFPIVNESNIRYHLNPVAGRRLAMLVVHEKPSERRIAQKKAVELVKRIALSRQMHAKYQFILLEGAELAEKLIGWTVQLPALFVYEPYTGLYFMYRSEGKGLTEDSLNSFLQSVYSGNISPEGGATLLNNIIYIGRLIYAIVMTMITHRPVLSLAALLSLLGVIFFYLIVLCQKKGERRIIPNNSRTLAKKAALRKKKKEEAKKAAKKSKDGTSLRSRQGRRDDTGIDSEELSQSDVRTGTGTETGTQSEGEPDSQIELSSGEETKKDK